MKPLIPCLLAAALACAQSAEQLEIRGTVVEGALGIAGATVTLYEFGHTPAEATTRSVFATTSTDSTGAFVFHPARAGEYYVEVKKEGYFAESFDGPTVDPVDSTGDPASIDQDHPSQERKFSLMRLGELRGRVIDENGKPLAKLSVLVQAPSSSSRRALARATTDQDGYFAASKLRPADYLVRIGPQHGGPEILAQFSEGDLKTVDQDLESSFWPGGGDERSAYPLPVNSGASLSVGTITARKATYYRAHLSVQSGDCAPGEKWNFSTRDTSGFFTQVSCRKDFLVRNLAPGSHSLVLSTNPPRGEKQHWAVASVEVTDHNLEIALIMAPGADISGRLVAADGATLPPPGKTSVAVSLVLARLSFETRVSDPGGTFRLVALPGDRNRISVNGLAGKFYLKEIRYNGLAVTDGIIKPMAGAPALLEIVIDDKAATISGSVAEREKVTDRVMVVAVKWPVSAEGLSVLMLSASAPADDQGRFQIGGLAPGEYRVLALTGDMLISLNGDASRLLSNAEKVTLERGSSQSVSLKIVEP
jgi:Carboxypeptidase regulatory-like domain